MNKDMKKILFSEDQIRSRCIELGRQISDDYTAMGSSPLLVGLLRGSVPFMAELIKHLDLDAQYDFMDVTSYAGTKSTGDIKIIKDLDTSIEGKDILLVEDIVDTGRTIKAVKELMRNKGARSVKVVTLLDKPERRVKKMVKVDYTCFTIPDEFVVGYGLDYDQRYRNFPYIGVVEFDEPQEE